VKIKFEQFLCARHLVILDGIPFLTQEKGVWVPDLSDMSCVEGATATTDCNEHWTYDLKLEGSMKVDVRSS
jgi:hypothetical protein